jgi:hypothetical protein
LPTDGRLDRSFGNNGRVRTDFGTGSADYAFDVTLQPGGRIVAAGWSRRTSEYDGGVARYRTT